MFKNVEGFENYSVNEEGLVKNNITGSFLKPSRTAHGYFTVTLFAKDKKPKKFRIHRLVASLFIPKQIDKPDVNPIEGDKSNNHVNNLEWVNKVENDLHAKTKLKKQRRPQGGYCGQYHSRSNKFRVTSPEGSVVELFGYSELENYLGFSRGYLNKKVQAREKVNGFVIEEVSRPQYEKENLTEHLVVRLTKNEDEALEKLSKAKEKPKSYFVRVLLINFLKQEKML